MSALDGWIDICRAGTWRDMQGHDVRLDEDRLDRIVATHAAADPAPVVIGHPEADAPAYAWIDGLRRAGDRLQAKLRDIAPSFREAVEAGRYSGRSIALQGDTLRHVGFLGGRAPAVSGLVPTRFAAAPQTVVAFTDDSEAESPDASPADHPDSLRALGPGGDEDGDSLVSLSALQGRGEAGEEIGVCPLPAPGSEEDAIARARCLLNGRPRSRRGRRRCWSGRQRQRPTTGVVTAEAVIAPHVDAGRVLPAERSALVALFAALGDDFPAVPTRVPPGAARRTSCSSAGTGGRGVMLGPFAILERIEGLAACASIPDARGRIRCRREAIAWLVTKPCGVDYLNGSLPQSRNMMAVLEAATGVTLTPAEAVDRARAKRGLGIGGGT